VRVVVVALLVGEGGGGVLLLRVGLELLSSQGAREMFQAADEAEVEARCQPAAAVPPGARIEPVALLLGLLAIALATHDRCAPVEVDRTEDQARGDVLLEEAVGPSLAPDLDGAGVVARLRDEVDGSADGVGSVAKRVSRLVDLDPLRVHQLDRFEVAEAVRLAVDEAVEEEVDVAVVEVVLEPRAADRKLALVGEAEARPHEHARNEVEHAAEVLAERLLDGRLADDLRAARDRAFDVLPGLVGRGGAAGLSASALDDHGRERRR